MVFKHHLFACVVISCFMALHVAMAADVMCPAGEYGYWTGWFANAACQKCHPGCYCPGGTHGFYGVDRNNNMPNYCKQGSSLSGGDLNTVKDGWLLRCPENYPNSNESAKSINDCFYKSSSGKTLKYGEKIVCAAGSYLPIYTDSCKSCPEEFTRQINNYRQRITDLEGKIATFSTSTARSADISNRRAQINPNTPNKDDDNNNNSSSNDCQKSQKCRMYMDQLKSTKEDLAKVERQICPGLQTLPRNNTKDQGIELCNGDEKPNASRTACEKSTCPFGQVLNSSKTQCVTSTEDCDAGQYLPKNKLECARCPDGWACKESKTYTFSTSQDQGKTEQCTGNKIANSKRTACETCPNGQAPNAAHTQCVEKGTAPQEANVGLDQPNIIPGRIEPDLPQNTPQGPDSKGTITCAEGTYLKKNSNVCELCNTASAYYCPGGVFNADNLEHGLEKCDSGYVANEDHTACVEKEPDVITVIVPAGQYLKANEETPSNCLDVSNKYCPGGTFEKSAKTQGIYECPLNSRQNTTKNGCNISFTMEQLRYGYSKELNPAGCWIYDDPDDYKDCVLGQ